MAKKIFISYASADQETANKLVAEIERRGIECWLSSRNIRPGQDYQKEIVNALENCGVVLLLFSQHANESVEIPKELALASRFRKTIIPARIEDIVPSGSFAYQITSAQFIDLFRGFESKIEELCAYLAEVLAKQGETVQLTPVRHRVHIGGGGAAKKFVIAGVVVLVVAVLGWVVGRKVMWRGGSANEPAEKTPMAAAAPASPTGRSAAASSTASSPASPTVAPGGSVAGSTPVASAPAPAAAQVRFLKSESYGGIRFDVKSINVSNLRAPVVLVSATNTGDRDLKFKIYSSPEPNLIDSNGAASGGYQIDGAPFCGPYFNVCSQPNPTNWASAYRNTPLDISLAFRGPADFRGSNASVSFAALVASENDDGSLRVALIPVVLPNLTVREAVARPVLMSRAYGGINFDVVAAKAEEKVVRVLIYATNTGQHNLKFKIYANPGPKVVDSNGAVSGASDVAGVPVCAPYLNVCSEPDPTKWTEAYRGIPLAVALTLRGPQDFRGTSGNVSFVVLLGAENEDGSLKVSVLPVVLPGVEIGN